jgi:tRNA A-37 threonylcarbamoyl transferase component Bud32
MNYDSLEIKIIDEETAQKILGNLEDKSLCIGLEKFYCSGVDCNNLYTITNKGLGKFSAHAKIYEACKNENCDFVAKWMLEGPDRDPDEESDLYLKPIKPIEEALFQYRASQYNLAPKVRQVWQCNKGIIIIMDALSTTAGDILKHLEYNQTSKYNISNINSIEDYLEYRPISIPDSEEQKNIKIDIVNKMINIINKLHKIGISHGDAHLDNFMFDKEGKIYFIDFGFSEELSKFNNNRDYKSIISSIETCIKKGYTNLQYLLDYTRSIIPK